MAKSRSAREASHQPVFMGSCLTICQKCLPYPPSGRIRLCIGARWDREKCLVQQRERRLCPRPVLDCCGAIKKCMAVVTSNSHRGSPGSISWSNQIYSHLLPRNWRVKTMEERDHEVVCRWCQLKNEGNWDRLLMAKTRSARGAFQQPAFMGSCLSISHMW